MTLEQIQEAIKNASLKKADNEKLLVELSDLMQMSEALDDQADVIRMKNNTIKKLERKVADRDIAFIELDRQLNACLDSQKSELLDEYA